MIYNVSEPNATIDSIHGMLNYTFSTTGLIIFFIIIIIITLITVICVKKML